MPFFWQAIKYGALVPKWLIPASCANSQSTLRFGNPGLPSYKTMVAPLSKAAWTKFHIIQPVVENQKKRSPGCTSLWKARYFKCSSKTPPWLCVIALGIPVVPEEYKTQIGCSKGSASNFSSAFVFLTASSHNTQPGKSLLLLSGS